MANTPLKRSSARHPYARAIHVLPSSRAGMSVVGIVLTILVTLLVLYGIFQFVTFITGYFA